MRGYNGRMPNALVITAAGINCDLELARAFEAAGATATSVHLNTLMREPALVDKYDLIGLPGGFSYGDAVAAGRIMAQLMRRHLYTAFVHALERSVPIFAPCNGFQIAAQMGLLPGPGDDEPMPSEPSTPRVALANNSGARFIDRWVKIDIPANTRCIWTQGIELHETNGVIPIAHGEGRFVAADDAVLDDLEQNNQIAIRYAADDNPNGSVRDIAGICDRTGLLFGLMPHPERFTRWTQHPHWTRLDESQTSGDPLGLAMFRNAVEHAANRNAVAV